MTISSLTCKSSLCCQLLASFPDLKLHSLKNVTVLIEKFNKQLIRLDGRKLFTFRGHRGKLVLWHICS